MDIAPPTFGDLLRRHRLAAGLSQEALAERSGLSARGVSDLERGVHRAPRRATVALLTAALGLAAGERAAIAAAMRRARPPGARAAPALPVALTSFVGREREIEEVRALLTRARLVTLTGTGGVGKTRLALQVAAEVVDAYPDGAWLVELASLANPDLVPQAVASALGVREQPGRPILSTLLAALAARRLLLVLDNCEHLLDACAALAEALLRACPGLTILATGRERLNVAGETAWRAPSLALPPAAAPPSSERWAACDAARLFVERARAVAPDFGLTTENAPAVAEICRRLDGVPLALELAAARLSALSAGQVAARLGDRFRLLTGGSRSAPPRHKTLRAALDWSHDLLAVPERIVLRRLAVFAGGWELAAAEAVGAGAGVAADEVLDLLARLVDQSLCLVGGDGGGEPRYRLLETVRAFALEHLEAAGEAEALRARHAAHYLALAEAADRGLRGPARASWMARLEAEADNLRTALAWLLTPAGLAAGGAEAGLRLAAALWWWWMIGRRLAEGERWLEAALGAASPAAGTVPTRARAEALTGAGMVANERGDPATARRRLAAALAAWRAVGDPDGLVLTLVNLGFLAVSQGEGVAARRYVDELAGCVEEVRDPWRRATGLVGLAYLAWQVGDDDRAAAHQADAVALTRAVGDEHLLAAALYNEGDALLRRGQAPRAAALFAESLTLAQRAGDAYNLTCCLVGVAGVAVASGRFAGAARLLGATDALLAGVGGGLNAIDRAGAERHAATARAQLGEAAFAAAVAAGAALGVEAAVAAAIAEALAVEAAVGAGPEAAPAPRGPRYPCGLSRREVEVLGLLAGGAGDAAIAARLSISVRTVNGHVAAILSKTGRANRTAAAAFARDHGLA